MVLSVDCICRSGMARIKKVIAVVVVWSEANNQRAALSIAGGRFAAGYQRVHPHVLSLDRQNGIEL